MNICNIKQKCDSMKKPGSCHWWSQRFTAVLLVPLMIVFICFVWKLALEPKLAVQSLLNSPFYFLVMLFALIVGLYHGKLGVEDVIDDYIHCSCSKKIARWLVRTLTYVTILGTSAALIAHFFKLHN